MFSVEPTALIKTLSPHVTKCMELAAEVCVTRSHYEVTVEHLLGELLQDSRGDARAILQEYNIDANRLQKGVLECLEGQRVGNAGRPVLSPLLLNWIQQSWLLASTEFGAQKLGSGALLTTLILSPRTLSAGAYVKLLAEIPRDELRRRLPAIIRASEGKEDVAGARAQPEEVDQEDSHISAGTALSQFTIDFTAVAKKNVCDPVIGRGAEIRQCIDILARRRKNNPIIVGEAGVGKTALVEGLAQQIVEARVPDKLKDVRVLGLDLGLLQAGASMKGEFEKRLGAVIAEVRASIEPVILFIDEAHMMVGAGGPAGGSDAANLLKPALARGELRTIAATTWSEYKKYFEKDSALARRFQIVKLDEPSRDTAVAMLRGLAPVFEKDHSVRIRDEALVATVELSSRYLSGRQLPDKAVDVLDTCMARVALGRDAPPAELQKLEYHIRVLEHERKSLERDQAENFGSSDGRLRLLTGKLGEAAEQRSQLEANWKQQREAAQHVLKLQEKLTSFTENQEAAGDDVAKIRVELEAARRAFEHTQGKKPLVSLEVDAALVARVISDWTGIPAGKMLGDEAKVLIGLEKSLKGRVHGQDYGLRLIAESIRAAKLSLTPPEAPLGVFLLVGPSGVGKTETALAMADTLFGGERFLVTINMSEFQEKHTVSRLIGSPPGYVGFGEGGVLTEAVRQRPYSIVVLDEVEKADPEVLNLFYQVFDKGMLADGEGRVIDFQNTVIVMTSNLGSEVMLETCASRGPVTRAQIIQAIKPSLVRHFKPALLARMKVVPYFPLSVTSLTSIVGLKLRRIQSRLREVHGVRLELEDSVLDQITARCTEVESGARNVDQILSRTLLPLISRAVLDQMAERSLPPKITVGMSEDGEYRLRMTG